MTDIELDKLKAREDAAWQRVKVHREAGDKLIADWSALIQAVTHETIRREIEAEIKAETANLQPKPV